MAAAFSVRALGLSLRVLALSLRATTRNPVAVWHWIPDQVRDDKTGHGMTNLASGMTNLSPDTGARVRLC
jgi:hypothetical protein